MNQLNAGEFGKKRNANIVFPVLILLILIAGIFLLDIYIPGIYAFWFLYLIPILYFSYYFEKPAYILIAGILSIPLLILGAYLKIRAGYPLTIIHNRLGIAVVLSVATFFTYKRKKGELLLKDTRAQFDAALNNSPVPKMIFDENGKVLLLNKTWLNITGFESNELPTVDTVDTLIFDKKNLLIIGNIPLFFQKGEKFHIGERKVKTKQGVYHTWDLSVVPLNSYDSKNRSILCTGIDVTDRKRLENSLKKNLEKYKFTFSKSAVGIIHVSRDREILWFNKKFREMLGYNVKELLNKSLTDLTYPADILIGVDDHIKLMNHEIKNTSYEKRYTRKDGEVIWVNVTASLGSTGSGSEEFAIGIIKDITKEKLFELALKESEDRFRKTFEQAAIGIAHILPDGHWLRFNQKYSEILEYPAEDLQKMTFMQISYPGELEEDLKLKNKLLNSEIESYSLEKRYICKGGKVKWILLNCSLMKEEISKITYFVSVVEDITPRKINEEITNKQKKRAEQLAYFSKTLSSSELNFQTILDNSVRLIYDFMEDTCVIRLFSTDNKSIIYSAFYNPDENIMQQLREMAPEINQTFFEGITGQIIKKGKAVILNDPAVGFDGLQAKPEFLKYKDAFQTSSVIMVPLITENKILGVLSMSRQVGKPPLSQDDKAFMQEIGERLAIKFESARLYNELLHEIDQRKSIEAELKKSEERFRDMAESMPQIVWTTNPDGAVDYFNGRWMELTGMSMQESLGWNWTNALHPDDKKNSMEAWTDALISGSVFEATNRFRRFDDQYRWHLVRSIPLRNGKGDIIKWLGTFTDIHEQRMIQQRFEETFKELERSNSDLEQFAYVASHDLQEPLRMISSYLKLLTKRYRNNLDTDAQSFIDYAVEGSLRMNKLLQGLLTYSRISTRANPFDFVDLDQIIRDVLYDLQFVINESKAEFSVDKLPVVKADKTQMRQLFQNLVANAIKFRDANPPIISIKVKKEEKNWVFSVQDNGIGIEPEYFERIFIIFQRLHERDKFAGTGIGLSICKKIVEKHSGRLWVESEPGKGATFLFTLPFK